MYLNNRFVELVDVADFIIGKKSPLADINDGSDMGVVDFFDGINSSFVDLVMGCISGAVAEWVKKELDSRF